MPAHIAGTRLSGAGRRRCGPRYGRGFQLLEMLLALAVAATLAAMGVPRLLDWTRDLRVELAAHELVGVLRAARVLAIRHSSNVGVKFRTGAGQRVWFTLYRDGDNDGVRTSDIATGVDTPMGPPRQLKHLGGQVRFGFPPGPPPRDPGDPRRRLNRLTDPIRFNRSDIASFSQLGTSTPGSLYVTDGQSRLSVVRLFGRTGKVKVMRYDMRTEKWG